MTRGSGTGAEAVMDGTEGTRRRKRTKGADGEMELISQAPSGPIHSTEGMYGPSISLPYRL